MDLNNPEIRQGLLADRLGTGVQIVAAEVAQEFDVSIDTIRRDIIALEGAGVAHRVRGGAVPVSAPAAPMHQRASAPKPALEQMATAALARLGSCQTLALDGGSSVLSLARQLPASQDVLIVTPSPWIAVACHERGLQVFQLGGKLSARGGIAISEPAQTQMAGIRVDLAVLGSCGVDSEFGLSCDEYEEVAIKKALVAAADRSFVLADKSKLGLRARHHTMPLDRIDLVVTDASASETDIALEQNVDVLHA